VPTVPPVTVPSIPLPLPGTQSGSSTGAPQPTPDVEICVGPIRIGTC
jgi:hypothetical protein